MIKFFIFIFYSLFTFILCLGVEKNPDIKRICLDYNTFTATIFWEKINDICNSFQKNTIYVSENEGSWIKLTEISDKNILQYSYIVSNLTSIRKYKIVTYTACNNIDSFESNAVYIDKNPPENIEIDSVSFDMKSQKIIIGWKRNPSIDIMGYKILKYNNSVGSFITNSYIPYVELPTYNSTNPESFSIASFDSCFNYSLISNTHKSAYLYYSYDSCKKKIDLSWTNYDGWKNYKTFLIINRNETGFKESIDVTNSNTFSFKHLSNDTKISIYLRTVEIKSGFTSSSNTIFVNTREEKLSKINYLSNVSVVNNKYINTSYETDSISSNEYFLIYKSNNLSAYSIFDKIKFNKNQTHYSINDENVDIGSYSYSYFVKTINICNDTISVSNIGKSILLTKDLISENNYKLLWNKYSVWEKGIKIQEIQNRFDDFTWNTLSNKISTNYYINLNIEDYDSVCFRVINRENLNSINTESISISNEVCVSKSGDLFFPQTINPKSNNNTFKVYGKNLEFKKSHFEIYNRWGQLIYQSDDIIKGWDFKKDGHEILAGTYIFFVKITDINYRNKTYKGTIQVIY